jgi:hypothetical protein
MQSWACSLPSARPRHLPELQVARRSRFMQAVQDRTPHFSLIMKRLAVLNLVKRGLEGRMF